MPDERVIGDPTGERVGPPPQDEAIRGIRQDLEEYSRHLDLDQIGDVLAHHKQVGAIPSFTETAHALVLLRPRLRHDARFRISDDVTRQLVGQYIENCSELRILNAVQVAAQAKIADSSLISNVDLDSLYDEGERVFEMVNTPSFVYRANQQLYWAAALKILNPGKFQTRKPIDYDLLAENTRLFLNAGNFATIADTLACLKIVDPMAGDLMRLGIPLDELRDEASRTMKSHGRPNSKTLPLFANLKIIAADKVEVTPNGLEITP